MKIYYAHHQWKYGSKAEEYELRLIKEKYPNADIFNPAVDLKTEGLSDHEIMNKCLMEVESSDMLVFSSLDGFVGIGCYEEVMFALSIPIPVGLIKYNNNIFRNDFVRF